MEVGRKSMVILVAQAVGAFIGAIALAFIGRNVLPSQMGMVAYAMGLAGLVGSFAQLGLNQAHIRKVHDHALDACHGTFFALRLQYGGTILGFGAILFAAWNAMYGYEDTTIWLLLLALLYQATLLLRGTIVASFNAWQQTARAQIVPLMDTFARAPTVIAVTLLLATHRIQGAAEWVMGTYVLGATVGLLFAVRWFKKAGYHLGTTNKDLRKAYLAFGLPLAISGIVSQWILQMDTVMIGFFGNASDVGAYFAANRITQIVLTFPTALGILLLPNFTKLYKAGENAKEETGRTLRQLSLAIIPPLALFAMYPETVLRIAVGGKYAVAAEALRWLALYAILATLRIVPLTLAKARDQPRIVLQSSILNLGSNIVLNALLIPQSIMGIRLAGLGIEGAAIATLASQALAFVFIAWTQRSQFGRIMLLPFLAPAIAAIVFVWWLPTPHHLWEFGFTGVAFCAISWFTLYLLKAMKPEDVRLALDAIHPIRFLRYVRSEMRFRPPS